MQRQFIQAALDLRLRGPRLRVNKQRIEVTQVEELRRGLAEGDRVYEHEVQGPGWDRRQQAQHERPRERHGTLSVARPRVNRESGLEREGKKRRGGKRSDPLPNSCFKDAKPDVPPHLRRDSTRSPTAVTP